MTDDMFEMPDMDDIAHQMEEAMKQAQQAMDDLPGQMEGLEDVMGSLSGLMEGLPGQLEGLEESVSGFTGQHQQNMESLVGEPDWKLTARIRAGSTLEVKIEAVFDLRKVIQTRESTQGGGLEGLVSGLMQEHDGQAPDQGMLDQVMGQLQKGRGMARVESVDVLRCSIAGAPADAVETLQLSPEANIPLVLHDHGLGFEFAPMLTIRSRWEHADLPAFSPTGDGLVVALESFQKDRPFRVDTKESQQDPILAVDMAFEPLE